MIDKKPGPSPKFDHEKVKQMLLENKKPVAIMLALGCSYGVIRYVRNRMRKKKRIV